MKKALISLIAGLACLAGAPGLWAAGTPIQAIDSGSYGIYVNGKRVATETFKIEQKAGGNTFYAEIRVQDGSSKPTQTSEIQLSAIGELKHYEWHQFSPSEAQAVITPSEPFLVEHLSNGPGQKPVEQPFMLPTTTLVLDNNFFSQRELLAWRYMAIGCKQNAGHTECRLQPTKFGVLVPQGLTSASVEMDYGGRETVSVHGTPRELTRLNLNSDGAQWSLWLDDNYKLIRILVPSENTEVVRD